MLATTGARISEADSARNALRLFAEDRPDIILADVAMPGQDGYSMMRALRGLPDLRRRAGSRRGDLRLRPPRGQAARVEVGLQRSRRKAGADRRTVRRAGADLAAGSSCPAERHGTGRQSTLSRHGSVQDVHRICRHAVQRLADPEECAHRSRRVDEGDSGRVRPAPVRAVRVGANRRRRARAGTGGAPRHHHRHTAGHAEAPHQRRAAQRHSRAEDRDGRSGDSTPATTPSRAAISIRSRAGARRSPKLRLVGARRSRSEQDAADRRAVCRPEGLPIVHRRQRRREVDGGGHRAD